MESGIKNWMFVSVALVLAESGRLLGARLGWHIVEITLDSLALLLILIMCVRYVVRLLRR